MKEMTKRVNNPGVISLCFPLRLCHFARPIAFLGLIGVFVIVVLLSHSAAFADTKRYSVPVDNSPQKGPRDAPVTIIEFLDFQ
jgi:hypothetical protein